MTYDYKCNTDYCIAKDKTVEKECKSKDVNVQRCDECGKILQRIWSVPSVKTGDGFKGY